jgi:NTP pyrophosphatase (non-canonical NTP hydrolase)
MGLNELRDAAYDQAKASGFHDDKSVTFGDRIALVHSELSEALEDFRRGEMVNVMFYEQKLTDGTVAVHDHQSNVNGLPSRKPAGIPSEIADVIIRCLDMAGAYGIDIERAVAEKMAYNATRPRMHGGKRL